MLMQLEWFVEIGVVRKPTNELMSEIARLQLTIEIGIREILEIGSPFFSCRCWSLPVLVVLEK
jgi:hypothetical protein